MSEGISSLLPGAGLGPEAEVKKCAGWILGDEMFPAEALLEVFSSRRRQLRAAERSPKLELIQ